MNRKTFLAATLFVMTSIFAWKVLGLEKAWYIEDDPYLYAFVEKVPNPNQFFLDKEVVQSPEVRYLIGANYTPLHFVSMWVDNRFFPRQPTWAYLHAIFSLSLSTVFLFFILNYFLPTSLALIGGLAFPLLPGTIVVTNFLSARHYLESFLMASAGIALALYQGHNSSKWKSVLVNGMSVILVVLSAFLKEVSIFPALLILLGIFVWRRQWVALPALLSIPIVWVVARWSLVGLQTEYPGSPKSLADLGLLILHLPRVFLNHWAGYGLLLLFLVILALGARRPAFRRASLLWILLLSAAILPIIPASMNLMAAAGGTWQRLFFVPGIVIIAALLHGIASLKSTRVRSFLVVAMLGCIISPFSKLNSYWQDLQARHKAEGELYLSSDRILVDSKVAAFWFLDGVHRYFKAGTAPHFVTERTPPHVRAQMIQKFGQARSTEKR